MRARCSICQNADRYRCKDFCIYLFPMNFRIFRFTANVMSKAWLKNDPCKTDSLAVKPIALIRGTTMWLIRIR